MAIIDLFQQINDISTSHNYWLIRTDSGEYFETYYVNGFIGINWNYVTIEQLRRSAIENVKTQIATEEKLNLEDPRQRARVTMIYNKLIRFLDLKRGDRVMMPSVNSDSYAFGIIDDEAAYVENDDMQGCPHRKRRRVHWVNNIPMKDLDPIFYKIRMSRHAISEVDEYSGYLDKTMDSLFVKEGNSHLVLDIRSRLDIDIEDLSTLMSSIRELVQSANEEFSLDEDDSQVFTKINLQSPGSIEIIQKGGRALLIVAVVLFAGDGSQRRNIRVPAATNRQLQKYEVDNQPAIDTIRAILNKYEYDRNKVNSTTLDGSN